MTPPPLPPKKRRLLLRNLGLPARITLACFLLSVGIGYVSAMVQLHMQHAGPGNVIPTSDDVIRQFHGTTDVPKSKIEKLLEADASLPFNGTGSMAPAFTTRSGDWKSTIRDYAKEKNVDQAKAEADLRAQRDGERAVMLLWIRSDSLSDAFKADKFPLPSDWGNKPLSDAYREGDDIKIKTMFTDRCTRCHAKDGDDQEASSYPMETIAQVQTYAKPEAGGGRVSLTKLAQSTHAHLLSFSVLFMLTGLLFAFTNYPGVMRLVIAPSVLIAQVLEISCWWLARLDGSTGVMFAQAIPLLGAAVGGGLGLQIVLTLFHLFGWFGRFILMLIFAAGGFGAYLAKEKVVDPFLKAKAAEVNKG